MKLLTLVALLLSLSLSLAYDDETDWDDDTISSADYLQKMWSVIVPAVYFLANA